MPEPIKVLYIGPATSGTFETSTIEQQSRAIRHVESLVNCGERRAEMLIKAARNVFASEPAVRVDYIECVDWSTLVPVQIAMPGTLIAVAAYVGSTRLIDNTILK